jgi:1,4-dihydroxy-6-naphthoate synthase
VKTLESTALIRVGHSPDPDDAFMFHALANDCIPTEGYRFVHELVDIETLNQRAFRAELELTAVSIHAYAYLHDKYALCSCGASMGDGYGPMVVAREPLSADQLHDRVIAVPGILTSAMLALRLFLGREFRYEIVPFDAILDAVEQGHYQGRPVHAGLIIHEGQLTFGERQMHLAIDLGVWWKAETGLPLPLGANAIRKDLGPKAIAEVQELLRQSIDYGLQHRGEALRHAMQYGRDLDSAQADRFVGMYVNDWTRDFGEAGREAVSLFLARGYEQGVLPRLVIPEFVPLQSAN